MIVAIIGYKGRVAKRHIKAWEELGWEWKGFDKGEKCKMQNFDVIDICTPPYLHVSMIKQAELAGVPVICEKPISTTVKEASTLLKSKHKIGIIYQFRFNPKIIKLKKEIEAGKYGEIKLVVSQYYRFRGEEYYQKWEGKKGTQGGTVFNVTIHYLDLMQWMFGVPKVYGFTNTANPIKVEDSGVAILKFPNGVIGSYIATTIANPQKHYQFSVYGTKGHKTIQLRQNEYHKHNFKAFIENQNFVTPKEAIKSLKMALEIIK